LPHVAKAGLGEIVDVDDEGCIFWRVLVFLQCDPNTNRALVVWAGTSKPKKQWVPLDDLMEPYNTVENIQRVINSTD
jgi:hypothetical protein